MRRTFRTCGYVKEAHYRQAWPGPAGTAYDAVGYAILRSDWQAGTITPPQWDDEPATSSEHPPPAPQTPPAGHTARPPGQHPGSEHRQRTL